MWIRPLAPVVGLGHLALPCHPPPYSSATVGNARLGRPRPVETWAVNGLPAAPLLLSRYDLYAPSVSPGRQASGVCDPPEECSGVARLSKFCAQGSRLWKQKGLDHRALTRL